ncbi:Tat pathway signal protein [Streptomyces sp. NPDC056638]|uniref:Tat pathway signal protein n=1 Tax=Streptomyces sp. NPDC056638 TaxID=3345887 RepID=UPI0036BD09BA
MNRSTTRKHRTLLTLLAAALSATAVPMVAPVAAEAAAAGGRVCLVLAPNSVDLDGRGPAAPVGHIGWAFRNGTGSTWTYGATEGDTGRPKSTFITTGSWSRMLHNFKTRHTGKQRYVKYRCLNTPSADVAKAQRAARTSARNGYNLARNNCLTKSVDIFHAYSPWLNNTRHLPDPKPYGISLTPNHYYNNLLPKAGWSGTVNL